MHLPTTPSKKAAVLAKLTRENRQIWRIERQKDLLPCPYCKNTKTRRNGRRRDGSQTFICPKCRKAFSEKTGTCFHNAKLLSKMKECVKLMSKGYMTLKETSLALNISIMTAFEWRHKILSGISQKEDFSGEVKMHAINLAFSRKGLKTKSKVKHSRTAPVRLLIAADSLKTLDLHLCRIGNLEVEDIPATITQKLKKADSVTAPYIKAFAELKNKEINIHFRLLKWKGNEPIPEISQISNLSNELRNWIYGRMHGVSTKYLQNYSGWFSQISAHSRKKSTNFFTNNIKGARHAWGYYTSRELLYEYFMDAKAEEIYISTSKKQWKTSRKLLLLTE